MDTSIAVALIGIVGTIITAAGTVAAAFIKREQQRQKREIDGLSFLIGHFLPHWELDHLRKLARGESLPYDKHRFPGFEEEVRQLHGRYLIDPKRTGFHASDLPTSGDLRDHFKLSPDGTTFLELWKQIEAKKQTRANR